MFRAGLTGDLFKSMFAFLWNFRGSPGNVRACGDEVGWAGVGRAEGWAMRAMRVMGTMDVADSTRTLTHTHTHTRAFD